MLRLVFLCLGLSDNCVCKVNVQTNNTQTNRVTAGGVANSMWSDGGKIITPSSMLIQQPKLSVSRNFPSPKKPRSSNVGRAIRRGAPPQVSHSGTST